VKSFKLGQRVAVSVCETHGEHVCLSKKQPGSVVRLRRCDAGAWVNLDERITEGAHPFPAGDHRENHVLTYPEFCEVAS
jgi:hypothetical protein